MQGDRRAHPRFPLILAVQYVGAETVLDYIENFSAGGLFIRTERELDIGERVALIVSFPQLVEPVELQVEVVRRRAAGEGVPAGVAVRVPDDRPDDREKLAGVARAISDGGRGSAPSARILLVEDNALVASIYTAALRRLSDDDQLGPFAIEVARDGADAFRRLLRDPPVDALVTDVFMPQMSGIALVEKIRAEPALASLPVIVVSAGGDAERDSMQRLGVRAFLRKPVSYHDLSQVVRSLVAPRSPGGESSRPGLTPGGAVSTDGRDAIPAYRR